MILSARGMRFDKPAETFLSGASENFYSKVEKYTVIPAKRTFFRQNDHLDRYIAGLTHRLDYCFLSSKRFSTTV